LSINLSTGTSIHLEINIKKYKIRDAQVTVFAGYPTNQKAGYRISGKAGYRISGKAGYRISGKAGHRISGRIFGSTTIFQKISNKFINMP
jgi:hypothetical protein